MKTDIVRRYSHNPILSKTEIPYPVETVHNAAVVKYGNEYIMLFRSHLRTGRSIIGLARSPDGFRFTADPQPFLTPERVGPFAAYEEFGVEDPRVTLVEGEFIITYSAYSRNGVRIALAKTKDFRRVERVSLITEADYRNVVIFPEKFNGLYARLDRPHSEIAPWSIWISYSPDLCYWGQSQLIMRPVQISLGRNEDRSGRAADKNTPGMAFHLSRSFQDNGWICLSSGSCSSRPQRSCKDHWCGGLVDFATRGSLGDNWVCSQRRLHLWRRSGA